MKFLPSSRQEIRGRLAFAAVLALAGALVGGVSLVRHTWKKREGIPATPATLSNTVMEDELIEAQRAAMTWSFSNKGLVRLAGLYHANGFFAEALGCYQTLARLEPREPRWPYLIGHLEAAFGRLSESLPWQLQAVELAPLDFTARLRLGDLFFKLNQPKKASEAYEGALALSAANPYALQGLARCALAAGDVAGAYARLREAVQAHPHFAAAWAQLADLEIRRGDAKAAAEARRRGNAQYKETPDPWLEFLTELIRDPYQLSIIAATSPDARRARELLERAVSLAPNNSNYRRQLAARLRTEGNLSGARSELERAVQLAPTDAEAWSALVELLVDSKQGPAASLAIAEGLRRCPQSGYLHLANARRLSALGRQAEAEVEYNASIRLQPTEIRGYVEKSALQVEAGRLAEAQDNLRAALKVDPVNVTVLGLLAQLAIIEGDAAGAETWAGRIQSLPTDESRSLERINRAYTQAFGRPLSHRR